MVAIRMMSVGVRGVGLRVGRKTAGGDGRWWACERALAACCSCAQTREARAYYPMMERRLLLRGRRG